VQALKDCILRGEPCTADFTRHMEEVDRSLFVRHRDPRDQGEGEALRKLDERFQSTQAAIYASVEWRAAEPPISQIEWP